MPYTPPGTTTTTVSAPDSVSSRHRRSFSNISAPPSMATTSTTGAFSSLGSLPTRRKSAPSTPLMGTPNKKATFQLGRDDDDDSPDEDDSRPRLTINTRLHDDDDHVLPPLRLKTKPFVSSFPPQAVPFPRSSPPPSANGTSFLPFPGQGKRSPTTSDPRRPSVVRTSSQPIILSTGKPLKSSLKSSSSSPHIPFPPQSLVPSILFPHLHQPQPSHHQRARSAPSTPHLGSIADPMESAVPGSISSGTSDSSTPPPSSPSPPPSKNVHFRSPEEGGLTTVKLFNRTAKPASLLRIGDETETETEGESSSAPTGFGWSPGKWGYGYNAGAFGRNANPFPKVPPTVPSFNPNKSVLGDLKEEVKESRSEEVRFEIDTKNSSPIPTRGAESAEGNIYFESLGFVTEAGTDKPAKPLTLTGTVLVRNITFQKTVTVRFTLDDWHTTNDVLAKHEKSLTSLPERFMLASLPLDDNDNSESGRRREIVCRPYGFEDEVIHPPEFNSSPTWDRFRFDISLGNYESTLDARTLIFVGRYTAGVPLPPSAMFDRFDGYITPPEEWWDNNANSNYRVSFSKRVVVDRRREEEEEKKRREAAASPPSIPPPVPASAIPPTVLAGYKRNVTYSAPPVFSPSKPFPAPPQISSSNSFPAPSPTPQQRQQAQEHQAALTQSTLARLKKLNLRNYAAPSGSGYTGSPITAASFSAVPIARADGDDHARTISTSSTSSTDSTSSNFSTATNSTNTSTDSTPLQTPTQGADEDDTVLFKGEKEHDVNVDVLGDDQALGISSRRRGFVSVEEREEDVASSSAQSTPTFRGGLKLPTKDGAEIVLPTSHIAQTASIMGLMAGTPESEVVMEMGTSPPFSAMGGMEMAGRGRSAPKDDSAEGAYWPWSSFASTEKKDEELLEGIKERNTFSPAPVSVPARHTKSSSGPALGVSFSSNGASNPLSPPQRRRGHHQQALSGQATFSLGGSSSGSGSGSDSTKTAHQRDGSRWKKGSHTHTQNHPVSAVHHSRPMSPLNNARTLSSVQNIYGQDIGRSSTPPFPGTSSPKRYFPDVPRTNSPLPLKVSPVNSNLSISTTVPVVDGQEQPISPGASQDDALYQAFVRQWCFASGPGPAANTGGINGQKERPTGNVVVR